MPFSFLFDFLVLYCCLFRLIIFLMRLVERVFVYDGS